LITGADALGLPGRINPLFIEGTQLPIATPIAKELNLHDGQVVQANLRLSGGQPELILKGRIINVPALMLGHLAPTVWMKVVLTAQGEWALQPTKAPLTPALQAAAPLSPPMTPSLSQVASMPPAMVPAAYSRMANLLFRPPGPSDVTQLFRPGTLDALLKTLARPDLQAQWRGMQLSMAQLSPEMISKALAGALGAEVWLARGMPANTSDPKLFLRRVMQAMQGTEKYAGPALRLVQQEDDDVAEPVLPELIESKNTETPAASFAQLQHAMDEMESAQVQAVQAQAQREVLFRMTLPFVDAEPAELVFRREPRSADQLPLLTVNVHSRSEIFGPVWLKTQLEGSQQIDLTMWAEKADVASTARQRASELGSQLQSAGLNMRSFKIVHGARPAAPADFVPTGRGLVVDMSA
jgi:hypothetical protein